jgi:hypothetical protein
LDSAVYFPLLLLFALSDLFKDEVKRTQLVNAWLGLPAQAREQIKIGVCKLIHVIPGTSEM